MMFSFTRSPALALLLAFVISASGTTHAAPAPWLPRAAFPASHLAALKAKRLTANPAVSSRWLPATFTVGDASRLAAFRALVARVKLDSTRHWQVRDGRLRVSYDLMQDLSQHLSGGALATGGGRLGDRMAEVLARSGLSLQPSGSAHADYLPDDEWLLGSPQWALHNTGAVIAERPGKVGVDMGIEKVWDKFSGADSLVVAVVDAGFDFNHPDLKGRNWINKAEAAGKPGIDDDANGYVDDSLGWDFVENDNLPQDRHGHGTFVSSVIAANFDNRIGVAGVLAHGRIMPVRVLDASGHGDQADIAKGILYAVRNGAKAINFSIGGDGDNLAMRSAFQAARDAGVPIIVAAGNDGIDLNQTPAYPAAYGYENMLVTAAHDHAGLLCSFSNFGKTVANLAAPGELVLVCGVPTPIQKWEDLFESDTTAWDTSAGNWAYTKVNPLEGKQSLAWKAGNNATATLRDTLDLTGIQGAYLVFRVQYQGARTSDAFIVSGKKVGASTWTDIAILGGTIDSLAIQSFGLQELDGAKVQLRVRTALLSSQSPIGRVLKLDDFHVMVPNPNPPPEPVYTVAGGTSLAAPHVTAYVALQRLACDRMGLAWTKARALTGIDSESAFTGKMSSNGRLNAYKGLQFYLSTLPDLRVEDSSVVAWKTGNKLEYSISVSPAPAQNYSLSLDGLPEGVQLDGAGKLLWTPATAQAGSYSMRITATGPSFLRKHFAFKIEKSDPIPVAIAYAVPAGATWSWAGRSFRLPPELGTGRHRVEFHAIDAAGKSQFLKRVWMDAPARGAAPSVGYGTTAGFRQGRITVDGIPLVSPQ